MKIKYRDLRTYKYQLMEQYELNVKGILTVPKDIKTDWVQLTSAGLLTINYGYCWDGPSGPAIDTPDFMRPSLIHDVCYQLIRLYYLPIEDRPAIDNLLFRLCIEDGMSHVRADYVYAAVRAFGASSCDPHGEHRDEILEAP